MRLRERSRATLGLHPMPKGLRAKVEPNDYVRIYGNTTLMNGNIVHFGFRVKMNLRRMGGKFYYNKIVETIKRVMNKEIPLGALHGHLYSTFKELHERSDWVRVRKIRNYEVGVKYER
jgi:hypothetical protein